MWVAQIKFNAETLVKFEEEAPELTAALRRGENVGLHNVWNSGLVGGDLASQGHLGRAVWNPEPMILLEKHLRRSVKRLRLSRVRHQASSSPPSSCRRCA